MAAPYNPPVKNEDFIFYVALKATADGSFKVNPTLAAGDVKVKKDSGAPANLGTLPAVDNSAEIWVKVTLTSTEMNADNVCIQFIDQTSPKEWEDYAISIPTTA
jgi:hypothetical protein